MGYTEKTFLGATFEQKTQGRGRMRCVEIRVKNVPGRGNHKCKGPEVAAATKLALGEQGGEGKDLRSEGPILQDAVDRPSDSLFLSMRESRWRVVSLGDSLRSPVLKDCSGCCMQDDWSQL